MCRTASFACVSRLSFRFLCLCSNIETIPDWLSRVKTVLLSKNEPSQEAKSYRPKSCLNIMSKLYRSWFNSFLCNHCETDNIITPEQAGGTKKVWGTTEHLLLNKSVLKEVRNKRNLYTIWLDYRKAFDSVTYEWLLYTLKLAQVPENLIVAIRELTKVCKTKLKLNGTHENIMTETIKFLKEIFQDDSLSVTLFIFYMNLLSHLLKQLKGYAAGNERNINITHNYFVDNSKLYVRTSSNLKKLYILQQLF